MSRWSGRPIGPALVLLFAVAPAGAADIDPHRALYSLTLGSSRSGSGVLGASGAMYYEWGETCDGWTVEQRFRLRTMYAESGGSELSSTLVTWESKDGLRYRFNERRLRNGEVDEELHGEAHLDGPDKGGEAAFTKPSATTLILAPGVIFPTAHTLVLIDRAKAGDQFVSRKVFDGSSVENATQITAVIGAELQPGAPAGAAAPDKQDVDPAKEPLLQHPGWRVRLAFFPPGSDSGAETPDYELGMRLLSNGVSQDMDLDYGDYVIKAHLDEIEPLPKPGC
ncbi:MAG TPA: cell envelope integrity EipB family protein [Stellaceae bacterium]|nr:cell envelope integrity EipB family protein [Stellaceae bacterium]